MRLLYLPLLLAFTVPLCLCATPPSPGTILTGTNTLDGEGGIIDGGDLGNTGYYVQSGSLTVSNVILQNFTTTGGTGSGGGGGLGGAVFVGNNATLTLSGSVTFHANLASGGMGGSGQRGGNLNGFLSATSNGSNGTNGDAAPSTSANENNGNGRTGYNGYVGGNASNGYGGKGGNGGNGSVGVIVTSDSLSTMITDQAEALGTLLDTQNGLFSDIADINHAACIGQGTGAAFTGLGAAGFGVVADAFADLEGKFDDLAGAANTFETTMDTLESNYNDAKTAAYQTEGTAGKGGNGGNGAKGGTGSFGFGGGQGGTGGNGGNAYSASVSSGGLGGAGGDGGRGGFGGGGGLSGLGGSGGSNGIYSTVNHGSLSGAAGAPGIAGFGAGTGSLADGSDDGLYGQGGAGLGGAIFVTQTGTLNVTGPTTFSHNDVKGGSSANGGLAGESAGTDLFIMRGATVNLNPGTGNVVTFNGTIADDSIASIEEGNYASGDGATVNIQSGVVTYNNANTYTGQTNIAGGVLQAVDGVGVHTNSNINLAGGVFESHGSFTRFLGTACNRVQFTGSHTGFSAVDGDLTVTLNRGAGLTWDSGSFVPDGKSLLFGSTTATDDVIFTNDIDLAGETRTILATANEENSNEAILTGVISNGSLIIGEESYNGTIVLTADNTYTGTTQVASGTLVVQGTLASPTITVDSGAFLDDTDGGLEEDVDLTVNGTFDLESDQEIGTIAGSGAVNINDSTLSINSGTFSGTIAGSGDAQNLTKLSAGTLTLSGTNTYAGTTQVSAGTLVLTGSLASSTVNVSSGATLTDTSGGLASDTVATIDGTMTLGANETIDTLLGSGSVGLGGQTFTLSQGTFAGDISGSGTVTKTTSGVLTLSGTNSTTGTFNASSGTVNLSGSLASHTVNISSGASFNDTNGGLTGSAAVTNNGTLTLGADDTIASFVNTGILSGTGHTLTATTYTLNDGSQIDANLGTGSVTTNGEVVLNGTCAAATVTVNEDSTLTLTGEQLLSSEATVNVEGTIELTGGNQTIATLNGGGTINSNIFQFVVTDGGDFTGTMDASETQLVSHTGELNVTGSTLTTSEIQVTGSGTMNMSSSTTTAGAVTVDMYSSLLVAAGSAIDNSGDVNVAASGNLSLTGTSSLTATGNLTMSGSSAVSLDASSSFTADVIITGDDSTLTVANSGNLTYSELKGTGTVDSSEFTNNATVSGFVTFTGKFVNRGTLSPGNSPGLITIGGDYEEHSLLNVQLAGLAAGDPGVDYDQIKVGGTVTIDPESTLNVEAYDGFLPTYGNVYQILSDLDGDPIAADGTFGALLFQLSDSSGSVANAAAFFDAATGQLITTGLNAPTSTIANLGTNHNQSSAAQGIFSAAQIGPNQINTSTLAGTLARQLINGSIDPSTALAYYAPDYYGAMSDYALMGDRVMTRQMFNRVSPFISLAKPLQMGLSLFSGYFQNSGETNDHATIHRHDYYVGGDLADGDGFSVGGMISGVQGGLRAHLGKGSSNGVVGGIYLRQAFMRKWLGLATFVYSTQDFDLERPTANGLVKGSSNSRSWTSSLGLQYAGWNYGLWTFAPKCQLIYSQANIRGFKEEGAIDALQNSGYQASSCLADLGLSALYATKLFHRDLKLELLVGMEQELFRKKDNLNLKVIRSPNISYDIEFAKPESTQAIVGVNLGYNLFDMVDLDMGYDGLIGTQLNDHAVHVDLRMNF